MITKTTGIILKNGTYICLGVETNNSLIEKDMKDGNTLIKCSDNQFLLVRPAGSGPQLRCEHVLAQTSEIVCKIKREDIKISAVQSYNV